MHFFFQPALPSWTADPPPPGFFSLPPLRKILVWILYCITSRFVCGCSDTNLTRKLDRTHWEGVQNTKPIQNGDILFDEEQPLVITPSVCSFCVMTCCRISLGVAPDLSVPHSVHHHSACRRCVDHQQHLGHRPQVQYLQRPDRVWNAVVPRG